MKTGILLALRMSKTAGTKDLPPVQMKLGKALRDMRKAHRRHFSQEEFALEAEINRGYYGSIERGEVNVSVLTLEKICSALGASMEELFGAAKL